MIQDPTGGVRTKRKTSAVTHPLEIGDLLEFVSGWDTHVRSQLESGYWYTVIDPVTLRLTPDKPGQFRAKTLSRGLARLAAGNVTAQVRCRSREPTRQDCLVCSDQNTEQTFCSGTRHGHGVYGLMHARDMADLKVVSQNLMHGNFGITGGIYAILSYQCRRKRIRRLGSEQGNGSETSASSVESLGM